MSAFNLPIDIPWTLIDCSRDMMDPTFCNKKAPPPFRSSIAVYAYQPKDEELPTELCGKKLTYLKISCSITGYQPTAAEIDQIVTFVEQVGEIDYSKIETIIREYFGCYGVLLNVAVFPYSDDLVKTFDEYPHIIDFEPKLRDFYQAATETGEVLTTSFNKVSTGKSLSSTDSTQGSWKGTANVTIPKEVTGGPQVAVGGETGQVRTETDQENWAVQSDASRERKEGQSTTTQLSQMYNLLTGYHAGTNRATFIMLPRPHVLQPTDHRTFVQGLRVIEGMQDFFLIVTRSGQENRLKVDVQLQTGHFPENVERIDVVPVKDQFDTRSETIGPFTKKCLGLGLAEGAVGAVADALGGDPPFILTEITNGPETFDGFEADGWEFDTSKGDSGHKAIKEHKLEGDNLDDFDGISFKTHTYKKEPPDKVTLDISVKNKNMWPGNGASKAKFSREYEVFLRKKKNIAPSQSADVAGLLITQRNLCVQIQFDQCITNIPLPREAQIDFTDVSVVDETDFDLIDVIEVPELDNIDPIRPFIGYARKKAIVRKIGAALIASANSPLRYAPGAVGFLQTRYLHKRLAKILPERILTQPARDFDALDPAMRDTLPGDVLVKDLLANPAALAQKMKVSCRDALMVKARIFRRRSPH